MGASDKLIENATHPLPQGHPVGGQAVPLQHILTQPTPELLHGVQPGGAGRQPNLFQTRQPGQGLQHLGMLVYRPIILDDVDAPVLGIYPLQLAAEGDELLPSDDVIVQVVQLAAQSMEPEALRAAKRTAAGRRSVSGWNRRHGGRFREKEGEQNFISAPKGGAGDPPRNRTENLRIKSRAVTLLPGAVVSALVLRCPAICI